MEYILIFIAIIIAILTIALIRQYDPYTTPTSTQLKDIRIIAKNMLKLIREELVACTNPKGTALLLQQKRVILEIYKKAKKGVKGSTIANLVNESLDLRQQYKNL